MTGLEALLAIGSIAGDTVQVTLVDPDGEFVYKPLLVEEPFALGPAEHHELAPVAEAQNASFVLGALAAVRPSDHVIELADGSELAYEMLVICVGGRFRTAFDKAITFPSPEPFAVGELLDAAAGGSGRIAFIVPPGVTWPLPIYEVALMTERRARETGADVSCTVITPEGSPLAMFGAIASGAVAELLSARGIDFEAGAYVHESEGDLVVGPGDRPLSADRVVALPVIDGPGVPGLPSDDHGFMPIDAHARVVGVEDVYAAGDGTNFPIKQGGLGTQQADAAAEDIASRAGADLDPKPFEPILRGKLIAGDESLNMLHDVRGGGGSGEASADYLWWPPHKISGRYLASWLAHEDPEQEPEPPARPLDVEVSLPSEWHEEPMALDPYDSPDVD